jgi:hypothetical protein
LTEAAPSGTADELLGQLTHDLSLLVRCDLELAVERRRPEGGRVLREIGGVAGAGVALLFATGALTWAAATALRLVLPAWCVPLIVAAAWIGVAALLVSTESPRLLRRLSPPEREAAITAVLEERSMAEHRVRMTARLLVRARAREAMGDRFDAAEHEAELLRRALIGMLVAPGRAGVELLERMVGRV